jgi:hypothetical protein
VIRRPLNTISNYTKTLTNYKLNWAVFGSCRNTGPDEKRGQNTYEVHMFLPYSHFKIYIASAKEHKRTCSHVHRGYDKHEGL